jgi:Protein of unknown function (DUF992)
LIFIRFLKAREMSALATARAVRKDGTAAKNMKAKRGEEMTGKFRAMVQMASALGVIYGLSGDASITQAQPASWTQVGMLTCRLNPSIGFVIFGHQSMECRFTQNPPLPPQAYEGALNTVGIDIGVTAGGVLGWAVFAPTAGPPPGALAGEYVGASGDIGLGLGAGVNVLVGGSGRSFALQPVSLEGSVAINVTVGLSGLQLRPVY